MVDEEKFVLKQFESREFDNWYFHLKITLEENGVAQWLDEDAVEASKMIGEKVVIVKMNVKAMEFQQ